MAKPSDLRLDLGFFSSVKTRRTLSRHGSSGVLSLLRLWTFVAEHYPRGVLPEDFTDDELEDICEWDADRNAARMRAAFQALGWVEDDGCTMHDWEEHQGWVFHAPERSEQAREAAKYRWGKKKKKRAARNAARKPARNAGSNAPSPTPTPTPTPLGGGVGRATPSATPADAVASGSPSRSCIVPTCKSVAVRESGDGRPNDPPHPYCGDHYAAWEAKHVPKPERNGPDA